MKKNGGVSLEACEWLSELILGNKERNKVKHGSCNYVRFIHHTGNGRSMFTNVLLDILYILMIRIFC